jgi:dTDP-glucose 4,6-dehydratase
MTFAEDRADYAIGVTKLETELSWKTDENFESGIVKTNEWCLKKYGAGK